MRFSQIQSITHFNEYIADCQVIRCNNNQRFGKIGESSHSMQSLVLKLQNLVRELPLLPSPSIGIALDGRVIIQAGMSEIEEEALFSTVNDLLAIQAKLEDLDSIARFSKNKGIRAKFSRWVTRVALHCRYGKQPTPAKLLAKISIILDNKIKQETRVTEQSRELMGEAKILIRSSLQKLQQTIKNALSNKTAIFIIQDELSESSSSSIEVSFTSLEEIPEPPQDAAPKPLVRPTSQLLQAGKEKILGRLKGKRRSITLLPEPKRDRPESAMLREQKTALKPGKRQSRKSLPKPTSGRPNSIMLRSQKSTLKVLDEAAKRVHSPTRTGWERVIGGAMDERRSKFQDSSQDESSWTE